MEVMRIIIVFIVMLSKAHLTSHSWMSGSRWMITPLWLSWSWLDITKCHLEGGITPSWEPLGWRIMGWGLRCLSEYDLPRLPFLRYHCGPPTHPISLQSHFLLCFLHSPITHWVCLILFVCLSAPSARLCGNRNWIWLPHHSISNTWQCLHLVGIQQMGGSY